MTTITLRALDASKWILVPFWRRDPEGYYDPHAGAQLAWKLTIDRKVGMFFWHGRGGRPVLAFRWKGQWIDGRRFCCHPLTGTGLLKMLYPMWDEIDEQLDPRDE